MPELVLVAASSGVPFDVRLDDAANPTALTLRHTQGSQLSLQVSHPLPIPAELVVPGPPGAMRLLTFDEMRALVISKGAALEESWHSLVAKLSRVEVVIQQSANGAAVINGVEITPSSTTRVRAVLTLNVRESAVAAAQLNARLQIDADCTLTLAGATLTTVLGVTVTVDADVPRMAWRIISTP